MFKLKLKKEKQLDGLINNSYYSIENITTANIDSLNRSLDVQLAETERYNSEIRVKIKK